MTTGSSRELSAIICSRVVDYGHTCSAFWLRSNAMSILLHIYMSLCDYLSNLVPRSFNEVEQVRVEDDVIDPGMEQK